MLAGSLAALVLAAIVFLVWPGLDLRFASYFALGHDRFVAETGWGNGFRHLFYWVPFGLFVVLVILWGLARLGRWHFWAPSTTGVLFLALSLGLGPGLLVNGILKNHSHRPRPYQVDLFGGDEAFRPFYRFDGACRRNCSFVSGEGSAATWTVAPALLVPLPWRPIAVSAALLFSFLTSLLRIAFGGHFLSDTVFAALITWLVILGCWRLVRRLYPGGLRPPV